MDKKGNLASTEWCKGRQAMQSWLLSTIKNETDVIVFMRPKLSPCFCFKLFWLNWSAFQPLAALFCHILQCFAQSTWRHCGFLRQHNMYVFANVSGLCVPVFFFCYYLFIFLLCAALSTVLCLCVNSRSGLPELVIAFPWCTMKLDTIAALQNSHCEIKGQFSQ